MVIAPLLGPNIALAFATSLGDRELMWQALRTNLAGLSLTLVMAIAIGLIWPGYLGSFEILVRTDVKPDGIVLALASGAAAVLSLASGLSSALVGVMVAVALLPPLATLGLLLSSGHWREAAGAGVLLGLLVVGRLLVNTLLFHFRPLKRRRETLRYTHTFGLGGMSLVLVMMLMGTGILMMFVYEPSPERAYLSVTALETQVGFGGFVRGIHHWSANLLVVIVVLHDLTLASRFCDRLVLLESGRVVATGTVENVLTEERLRNVYGIEAVTEHFPLSQVNEALDHLRAGKARYRIVLDTA